MLWYTYVRLIGILKMKYYILIIIFVLLGLKLTATEIPVCLENGGSCESNPSLQNNLDSEEELKYTKNYLDQQKDIFIKKNGNLKISKIDIVGLRKTDKKVIKDEITIVVGSYISNFDPKDLINRLQKKGIFSSIDIAYENQNGNAVIKVILDEKWTLIPLPVLGSAGKSSYIGLFLLETNFLGMNKTLMLGGIYGTDAKSASVSYIDPSVLGSSFNFSLGAAYAQSLNEKLDIKEDDIDDSYRKFKMNQFLSAATLGYNINQNYNPYVSYQYKEYSLVKNYSDTFNPIDGAIFSAYGIGIKVDYADMEEFLLYGFSLNMVAEQNFSLKSENKDYRTITFTAENGWHLIGKQDRFLVAMNGFLGNTPEVAEVALGSSRGFRSMPAGSLFMKNAFSTTFAEEYPFYKTSFGVFTASLFTEQGFYNNAYRADNYYFFGYGVSINLYLKQIALPALQLHIAHDPKTGAVRQSFSLGISL
jgi:outer membrane protein assembly factor BamA